MKNDSWKEYQKINTLYKRDMQNNKQIIIGDYDPNIEYLKDIKWECTEKIDGTNICISWDGHSRIFHGRTTKADIPKHLLQVLENLFPVDLLQKVFPLKYDENKVEIPMQIDLFGEGYGYKIQKIGSSYLKEQVSFILFDIRIDSWWLLRDSLEDIAKQLNIDIVPVIGYFTLYEAELMVRNGFKSTIAENKECEAEGLILKTTLGLNDRRGKRIITKIKTVDYRNLEKHL